MTEETLPPHLLLTPIAFYRLDAQDNLVDVNPAWLELHGYNSIDEVLGRNIQFVFVNPQDPEKLRKRIISAGTLKDETLELKRASGERFWGAIYSRKLTDKSNIYTGREGFIVDATERVIHQRIMKHIPIGYYAVDTKNGTDKITYCNKEFAKMFNFPPNNGFLEVNINDLYLNNNDYRKFTDRMSTQKEEKIQHVLEVQTIDKARTFSMEAIARIQRTETGEVTGRVGVVRDLTKDEPLNRLSIDLGVVLHSFTTELLVLKSDLDVTIRALGSNSSPQQNREPHLHLLSQMREPVATLRNSLAEIPSKLTNRNNDITLFRTLDNLRLELEHSEKIEPMFRIHALCDIAEKIASACQASLKRHELARQPLKQLRQDAYEVIQSFARYRLNERLTDILDMDHRLSSLRAYLITHSQNIRVERSPTDLWKLITQSILNLHDFAESRGVKFRPFRNTLNTTIIAHEQEILRAISNLLHNAIKYSWSRDTGTWIEILLSQESQVLKLEIENYGVPIPADEIEAQLIFLFGFRSRLSSDRGRVGTGIGLPDAHTIIEHHGGNVTLSSRPAFKDGIAENLDPFLTTATIILPIAR